MFRNNSKDRLAVVLLITIMAVALLAGCSSKSVKDDTPTAQSTSVAVTANPAAIDVNATSVVEATVTSGGSAVPNQEVTFVVTPPNAGYFTPTSATTDANGVAATMFTATATGSAVISATSTFADGTKTGTTGMSVAQDVQTGGNLTIAVSPSLLLANGSDSSIVTVTARDALGQVVPDNTVIQLVAGEKFVDLDQNGAWTPGIDSLVFDVNGNGTWNAMGQIPSSVQVSGGAGQAQATYVSGNSSGTAYIKATVTDEALAASADRAIQLSPNATINSIFLSSDSTNLVVRGTGGIETAIMEATAYDVWGNPVPEGIAISFVITDGPGGGERLDTIGAGPYSTITNSQGVAQVPLQSGTISGTVRLRAFSGTILSNAAQIMVSAGPPAYIVVGSEECNVPYWNTVGYEVEISAVVSDIYMNPVPNNTAVYFTTDEGTMKSHEARTADLEGRAATKWISGTQNGIGADGQVLVIAETAGGTVIDTSMFYNTHLADSIWAVGMPVSLQASATDQAMVTVWAVDLNGNPVVDATQFTSEARFLTVGSGTFGDGCYSSSARIKIQSATLEEDFSLTGGQDDGIGAIDNVRFYAAGASVSYPVQLLTGTAYTGNCKVSGPTSCAPGEQIRFTVEIADRNGNPLGDHTIVMSAGSGVVGGATQETNGNGEAGGFVWTAGAAGDVNIVFSDTDPRGLVYLSHKVTVE